MTRPAPVETVKPDPYLWKFALKLAGGNARRLEVRRPTEVVVHNQPTR